MESISFYCIGIDVDKTTFKACLMARSSAGNSTVKASKTFSNKAGGIKELLVWNEKHCKEIEVPRSFVMEATGVYHEHLAYYLDSQKQCVHVVLPNKAKRYMQSLGIRSKNDKIDAQGLATMGIQQELEQWKPISKQLYSLRSLTRQIESLQDTKTVISNPLEAVTHSAFADKFVKKSLNSVLSKLEKEILSCKKRVEKLIETDKELNAKYRLFTELKGFGLMTFAVIISETGGFELFKNSSQLVCYSGYDVVENQSGSRTGRTKISKKGNSHIRRIMHLTSFNVVRYKVGIFENLYERVYERTKIKMKAYVAVQRKLLCLVYSIWKRNEAFNPMYQMENNSLEQEPKPSFSVGSERTVMA